MLKCKTATEGSAQKDPDVPTPPSPIVCRERPNDNARKQTSSLCTAKCESTTDKCSICGIRRLTKCCSAKACLQCCVDTNCLGHKKARANALFRQRVLAKTTPVQQEAARIRSMKISSLRFKEAGFKYIGDTVVIWNLREYCGTFLGFGLDCSSSPSSHFQLPINTQIILNGGRKQSESLRGD